ncbi:MAG TPA: hypothetical protein VGD99_27465 [Anaerolineae bacterium]
MNRPTDAEQAAYALVDAALRHYPLTEAPAGLLPAVMARIQAVPTVPRFHLTWFDYAISFFGAGMAGCVLLLWRLFLSPSLTHLQTRFLAELSSTDLQLLTTMFLAGLTLTAAAVTVMAILFGDLRPRFIS